MNEVINNLGQIAAAAEYFDRKTGAAWKLRAVITNAVVWAANRVWTLQNDEQAPREMLCKAMITLATLRCWTRDVDSTALSLDLTPGAVRRTLGLERKIDAHEEACRVARTKCIQRRSAAKFQEFYNAAIQALDDQRKAREAAVESIANLISDNGFSWEGEFTDMRGYDVLLSNGSFLDDTDLYDDDSVELQTDRLAETVASVLEGMYLECEADLAAALTTAKINRLSAYAQGIDQMMKIVGIDTAKLARRQVALEKQMDKAETKIKASMQTVEADIKGEISKLMAQQNAEPQEPTKLKRHMVKGEAA